MASGLIMGLSNGIGGIAATFLGWVADQWGLPITLPVIFLFPLFGFLTFLFILSPQIHSTSSPNLHAVLRPAGGPFCGRQKIVQKLYSLFLKVPRARMLWSCGQSRGLTDQGRPIKTRSLEKGWWDA